MRSLVLPLVLLLALPGCLQRPVSESVGPSTTTPGTPTSTAPGFAIEGLAIVPASGPARALHEDDDAKATYTLRNPTNASASWLVSYLVGGAVRDVETITLAAGAARSFSKDVGSVRGLSALDVEARAGDKRATAHADVTPWPRTLDDVPMGDGLALHVNQWLQNTTEGDATDVNLTLARTPDANATSLRARALCADAHGVVTTARGDADVPVPEAGAWSFASLTLPGCGTLTRYGIELTTPTAYARVLFVERGWRPS